MTLTVPRDSKKPYIWFDLNGSSFFTLYKMEGVNPEDPEDDIIYFEVNASYLLSALGNMKKAANFTEIKLAKQEFPYFTVNMRIQSAADPDKCVNISNQIPVIIIPRIGWEDFDMPYATIDYDIEGKCPRFSIFKRYIDTFKCAKNVKIILREDETFTIEATGEGTKHFTIFSNIPVRKYNPEETYKGPPISVTVEHKKLSQWLHSLSFPAAVRLVCTIENNKSFRLSFRFRDDILGHFVVAADASEDDDEIEPSDDD